MELFTRGTFLLTFPRRAPQGRGRRAKLSELRTPRRRKEKEEQEADAKKEEVAIKAGLEEYLPGAHPREGLPRRSQR